MGAKVNVVAGGAGFIGSHLCRALLGSGERVVCVDDLSTGSLERISDLYKTERFHFVLRDINESLDIPHEVDAVYNLTCAPSLDRGAQFPAQVERCVCGARHLIELTRHKGAKLVFASSSAVYGRPGSLAQSEDDLGAVDCFSMDGAVSEAARFAETIHFAAGVAAGVDVRVARLFETYGPDRLPDDGRTVSTFVVQAMTGGTLTVDGDGLQTRSLCYVSDVVAGLRALMERVEAPPRPINIGNPNPTRIIDVARLVQRAVGGTSTVVHGPVAPEQGAGPFPDITRARTLLGWQPEISINTGIHLTVEYFPVTPSAVPRPVR